ncbi:hypothetical protein ASG70_08335 [Phycicoccus sp. Soil748]|nr:hypothetical protein ASG70_08335 [Phycicoccus sp. Soil748]
MSTAWTSAWSTGVRGRGRSQVRTTSLHRRRTPGAPPLVLGHRGSSSPTCRENSVGAVLGAMAHGADGVEVDVRLSADGVLVCSHDAVVATALGRELVVARTTAAELVARAATPHGRLATLSEVLSALADRGTTDVVVEAKPVDDQVAAFRTARALAALLVPLSTSMGVTVSSFDALLLGAVRRTVFGSRLRTALLGHEGESAVAVLRRVVDAGHDEAHLSLRMLRQSPHVVRMAHHRGISVTAWTVNGAELAEVASLGVDALITDDVAAARTVLDRSTPVTALGMVGGTAC